MSSVNGAAGQRSGWAETGRRLVETPRALAVAGALLGLFAVSESIARAAVTGASAQVGLALVLVALASTRPP
jgi:hypothetical protein